MTEYNQEDFTWSLPLPILTLDKKKDELRRYGRIFKGVSLAFAVESAFCGTSVDYHSPSFKDYIILSLGIIAALSSFSCFFVGRYFSKEASELEQIIFQARER